MHGDYEELEPVESDRSMWPVVAALGLFAGVTFFLWVGGCSPAAGAEPPTFAVVNRVPPKFEVVNRIPETLKTPAAGTGDGRGPGSTPPPVLLGWHVPQP